MIEELVFRTESFKLGDRRLRLQVRDQESSGRSFAWAIGRADALGVLVILTVTTIAAMPLIAGGTLVGQDSATQFYPWYGYLGQQLRSFEIPGWNPFQFAGAPFAADPQSGWTYLPAMLVFGVLPIPLAVPVFLWLHMALAGLGVFVLARSLRMPAAAGVVAATAYQLTGPVYGRSVCCPAAMEVAVWSPWVLAGAELAIRSRSSRARLAGWTLAGFALSQALAAWLGQGSYYLLLALAAFIAFRTLVTPADGPSFLGRLRAAAENGLAICTLGFGFAAVGLLPRFDYVARSNLADGEYSGSNSWAAQISGATSESVFDRLLLPTLHYPGTATLALALVGLLLARGRFAAPYFGFLGIAAVVLASPEPTPLHRVLYAVLPRFEELHQHWPERVSLVAYVAPALLAGAAVSVVLEQPGLAWRRKYAILVPIAVAAFLWTIGAGVPLEAILAAGGAVLLLAALTLPPVPSAQRAIVMLLVIVIAADLLAAGRTTAAQAPYGGFHRVDMGEYYDSTGAADFVNGQSGSGPFRVFGYDPSLRAIQDDQTVLYRHEFADPATQNLNVNNRSILLGLHDIQGYNPLQVQRYVEYMTALNGHPQDYHDANVFPSGLDSPLLNLLNVRYVVIPADNESWQGDFSLLVDRFPTVYQDGSVRVLENMEALPRAWIVHDVRQVAPGEALDLLTSGTVDPRTTALVEGGVPPIAAPDDPAADEVIVVDHQPDRIQAIATTSAAGLLVFSEVFDPGWRAFVDGESVPIQLVDHVLRAIPLSAGTHRVELRYKTPLLLPGAVITIATISVLIGVFLWPRFRAQRIAGPFGNVRRAGKRLDSSGAAIQANTRGSPSHLGNQHGAIDRLSGSD